MKALDQINVPADFKFARDHEWLAPGSPARVGVSDYAQDQLGDLTFVELPEVGASLARGAEFGSLESSKSVSSLMMPVAGVVRAVNEALLDDPGLVNRDPYGEGWIIEIEPAAPENDLLDAAAYREYLATLA